MKRLSSSSSGKEEEDVKKGYEDSGTTLCRILRAAKLKYVGS